MEPRDASHPAHPPSDEQIVEGVLAGDGGRFAALVQRHGAVLLGWLQRRTRTQADASDLYQEVWLRAYSGLARLEDPRRLRAWLLGIAFHTLDKQRRRRARSPLEPLGEREPEAAPEPPELERRELRARIAAAVECLPARQREVFELRALVGLDHAAIATRLGIREDNARANYYQALRRLRAELGDEP